MIRRRGTIRTSGTQPERRVEQILISRGVRFTRQASFVSPTGSTKIDFFAQDARLAIYVDGCFWHGHEHAIPAKMPAAWRSKIDATRARDAAQVRALAALGIRTLRVFACQIDAGTIAAAVSARGAR
jgi:DNA mismatch endonuclease (patch repair protein)